jgi:hypothetical protein
LNKHRLFPGRVRVRARGTLKLADGDISIYQTGPDRYRLGCLLYDGDQSVVRRAIREGLSVRSVPLIPARATGAADWVKLRGAPCLSPSRTCSVIPSNGHPCRCVVANRSGDRSECWVGSASMDSLTHCFSDLFARGLGHCCWCQGCRLRYCWCHDHGSDGR